MKKKKSFIICISVACSLLLLPVAWYNLPYYFRVAYYRSNCESVTEPFIEDVDFDISQEGYASSYIFDNKYVIPFVIEWHVLDSSGSAIPADVLSAEYTTYDVKIKADVLIDSKIVYSKVTDKSIPLSFIQRKNLRYFILGRYGYPLRCRFSRDAKLRLTVVSTDSRLQGLKGKLIVKPDITL